MHIHFDVMDVNFLQEKVKEEMYLESDMCKKKVDDAINVITNKIDEANRKLENYRQVRRNLFISYSHTTRTYLMRCVAPQSNIPHEVRLRIVCDTLKTGRP